MKIRVHDIRMSLKSILDIKANFTEDLRFLYESKVPICLSKECSTVVKSSVQLCYYASVLLGCLLFSFQWR